MLIINLFINFHQSSSTTTNYYTVRNTPFKGTELIPLAYPRANFGRMVQKDSTVYAARNGGVWRVSACYAEHPFPTPPVDSTICQGHSVVFHGDTLRTAGTYVHQIPGLTTVCDSLDVLRLKTTLIQTYWHKQICRGDTLVWNAMPYAQPGEFIQHLPTATGCDSSVSLYLNYYYTDGTTSVPLCPGDSFQIHGQTISTPGQYTFSFTSFDGCDSTLTVHAYAAQTISPYSATICAGASYNLYAHNFTETGEYWFHYGSNNCILYHLLLTVLPDVAITVDTFVAAGTEVYNQEIYRDTTFTALLLGPTNCDIILTVNAHTTVGTNALPVLPTAQAFPNPFRDQLTLRWPAGEVAQGRLYDARGQLCREARLTGPTAVWNTGDLPAGLYRAEIRLGGRYFAWKMVKMP